jgi:hypothetical protein
VGRNLGNLAAISPAMVAVTPILAALARMSTCDGGAGELR